MAGEAFEGHDRQSPKVRARIDRVGAHDLFMAQVSRRAHDHSLLRLGQRAERLRDAEVEDLHLLAQFTVREKYVLGLEVPMDDPQPLSDG